MRRAAILPVILLLAISGWAQTHHASARQTSAPAAPPAPDHFKVLAITVRGTERYSDREVLAASQLAPGQIVTQDQLQEASNRLGNSGVFSTVAYQFMGAPGGVRVTFDVTDNPQLVPVTFQNLVWVPDDALVDAIRQRVPLFKGSMPLVGEMSTQVRDAIQAILAEKGVNARVSPMIVAATDKRGTGFAYQADDVDVKIAAIDFPGRSAMDQVLLDTAVDPLRQGRFLLTSTAEAGKNYIRNVYISRGYLAMKVGDPQVTLVDPSLTAPTVELTFPVEEGKQYNLAGLAWAGNSAFPPRELEKAVSVTLGRPANLLRLIQQLNDDKFLYGRKGYMAVTFDPVPQLHDDGTAVITVNVHEGPQYKMGELLLKGLEPATEQKLRSQWVIPPGGVYDDSYPTRFVNEVIGSLPPGIHFQFQQTTKIDDQTRTVDVIIEYKRR